MPFQIICLRNKSFWSKVISTLAGFALVIVVMAGIFPAKNDVKADVQPTYTVVEEAQEE